LRSLFRWLAQDHHITVSRVSCQQVGSANGPRGMDIVAACVHDTMVDGGEIDTRFLDDRQRVNVAADRDGLDVHLAARDTRHYTSCCHTIYGSQANLNKFAVQSLDRAKLLECNLGVPVNGVSQVGQPLPQLR
jgi:hypothetical protein